MTRPTRRQGSPFARGVQGFPPPPALFLTSELLLHEHSRRAWRNRAD